MTKKSKKYSSKIVGYISQEIANSNNITDYLDREIIQSNKLDIHTNKHASNFFTLDSYHNTLINIDKIIKRPYYVEYDEKRSSLKYYGKIDQYVCVIVKIDKKDVYISTFYPQSKEKIDKIKNK